MGRLPPATTVISSAISNEVNRYAFMALLLFAGEHRIQNRCKEAHLPRSFSCLD